MTHSYTFHFPLMPIAGCPETFSQLNMDKTEILRVGSKSKRQKFYSHLASLFLKNPVSKSETLVLFWILKINVEIT